MSTAGWKKRTCTRGHINPARYSTGACIQCSKEASAERYRRDPDGAKAQASAYAKANPDVRRDYGRAVRLGVTVREVREAIARCAGRCQACSAELSHAKMCIDHDRVRGVLCRFCNALEGMLNKQPERIAQVRAYLARQEGTLR